MADDNPFANVWASEEREASRSIVGTIISGHMTYWPTRQAAQAVARANGGKAAGYSVRPSVGRRGKYLVKVVDLDDGSTLGFLRK